MNKSKLIKQLNDKISNLENKIADLCAWSKEYHSTVLELQQLRANLEDVNNTKCPVIKG